MITKTSASQLPKVVKQITFLTDLAKKLSDQSPFMELFDLAFIFSFSE